MARAQLRVYCGPQPEAPPATVAASAPRAENVTVRLGEILPLLADAVNSRRTWLNEFEDDAVTITTDLYEVILAYQHYRRPSA